MNDETFRARKRALECGGLSRFNVIRHSAFEIRHLLP